MLPVIGLSFRSGAIEDVDHEALWLALLNEVRQPGAHALDCSVIDCDEYIERKLSTIEGTQHVYVKEEEWEVIYRGVIDGKESAKPNARSFCTNTPWSSRGRYPCSCLVERGVKSVTFIE